MPSDAHIVCVVAARPNLMKMAPILRALARLQVPPALTLVHTGQHYDGAMNAQHFADLGLDAPAVNLEVGSGSHASQTAQVMLRFEQVLLARAASAVLVVGDVNSTLACALVAAKQQIPVIHVEAGLRSFDRRMPEEINRVLTDQLSTLLLTSEASAHSHLAREGIPGERIHFVGNVMIDSLRHELARAVPVSRQLLAAGQPRFLGGGRDYALVTLHRPSNVDHAPTLRRLLGALERVSAMLPLIFPVHPRTARQLARLEGDSDPARAYPRILRLPAQGYLQMLGLLKDARLVLTDSGGVQEESTALGVPCLTLRESTERPVTVSEGSNTIAGVDPDTIVALCQATLRGAGKIGQIPPLWDGHAADRIAAVIGDWLRRQPAPAREALGDN